MKVDPQVMTTTLLVESSDSLAARAAALALDDAHNMRRAAQEDRSDAQKNRIELLRRSADKLREMANMTLASGIFQGMLGGMTAVGSGMASIAPSNSMTSRIGTIMAAGSKADAGYHPFETAKSYMAVDKQELDTEAEQASHRMTQASDGIDHAKRLQRTLPSRLERLLDAEHAVAMAALKA